MAISPGDDAMRKRGYNCRVKVKCGAKLLYGWEGAGVTRCALDGDGSPTSASDTTGASVGDDPLLSVDLPLGRAVVSDDGDDAFSVEIALDSPTAEQPAP